MKFLKSAIIKIGNSVFSSVYIIMTMERQKKDTDLSGEDLEDPCKPHVDRLVYQTGNLLSGYWNKPKKKVGYKHYV